MKKILLLCFILFGSLALEAQITANMKLVDSTTSFKPLIATLTRGGLIKTATFHFYELNDKINQKSLYPNPEILVYQEGKKYKMKIQGIEKLIAVNKLQEVIESNIDGNFKGYDGNTSFRLVNQDVWKQDYPTGTIFTNLFRPAVTIYLSSEGYKMIIEGVVEDPILVKKN
jgi:hypothetical protein